MENSNLSAMAWALSNRAALNALTRALEEYFQAHDTGNTFEKTVTYRYLIEQWGNAKKVIEKGVWSEDD